MRAIVQRVTKATVTVGEEQVSSIGRGLCVLLGVSVEDTQKDADYIVRKILNLRLFEDENGRAWSKSVMDRDFEVLCVSQFTLQCILKGNKPDFHSAMPAELAQPFYNSILENMRSIYKPELIKDGQFGAYMQTPNCCQSRKSSSRGKRRRAPKDPQSQAGRRAPYVPDRTRTPVVEQRVTCPQRGSPSYRTGDMTVIPVSSGRP
ncbi:unnamed protein product [Pleuronectes platessa]|uniref:D-aminoacyl-tRNA deacylase n=1 Tax=Pleuronectes platessa TaxID=8262 RepID=A0A9N7VK86_PLEPL|nr:unnamed protein product [Pleuronectes platessa]